MKTNILNTMKQFAKYLCAALFVIGTSAHAWGAIVSIKGTSNDTWTYTSSQIAITKSGVTLAAKGYGTGSALASEVRVNNGTTITISASQAITKVEFTITSAAGFNQVDWDGVWEGSSTSVDFTAGGGQVVFTECKVTIGGYVILHDFAGDRMVAEGGTLPAVRLGTLKGWASAQYWTHVEVDDGNWPAYGTYYYEGTSAPSKDELWALYQNSCDNSYSTEPTSVYHISETNPASTSGGGTGYVKAYVSSVETYCNIPAGTSVEIRATAEGTPFASWTVTKYGDASTVVTVASSTSATTTFTMPEYNVSITGVFNGCTSREVTVFDEGSNESKTCNYGAVTSFDVEYVTDGSGAVTWTSTNTDVATVAGKGGDAATVTIVGAGTANIKATIAEDATYCVGEDVYPLTVNAVAPTVNNTNFSISSTTSTSATFVGGQVSAKGGADIATHGYVVGTASSVTWASGRVSEAGSNSDPGLNTNFTTMTTVTALSSGTTYYVRPFAYNGSQFGYGTAVAFTTPYAVTFDDNGADGGDVPATRYIANGSTTTLPEQGTLTKAGYVFEGWAEGSTSGLVRAVGYSHTVNADITFYAKWRAVEYTDAKFSCADWTLTGPSGDIVFITSAASKTVRSQEAFHVSASGLPASTALTFTTFPANTRFAFKKADGSAVSTDEYGKVNTDFYVFYAPKVDDSSDGLDEITKLYVSVEGEPRKDSLDTKTIIGRHLPTNFVIAVKNTDNQWYALPADMSGTGNPAPVAIRVDNTSSPTTAYCDNTNAYSLYASTLNNISVQLAMPNNPYMANAALWANNALSSTNIGKNGATNGSSTGLGGNYQWLFTQTATSISGIGDVKYTMSNPNNANPLKVWTNGGSTLWGLYANGSAEIRLLSLVDVKPMTMKVMEWGTNAIVVSYPNGGSATSPQARIGDGDAANVTLTSLGGDIYKIATISGLQDNPAKTLIITATESGTGKQALFPIPLIVTTAKTEAELRTAAGSNDIAKLTDVIIRDGGRMTTGTGSGNFNDIYIYPGGKAKITNNFVAKNIYMRGGYSFLDEKATFRYPDLCVESPATIDLPAAGKLYYDFYIDNRKYYMFSMPQDVTLESVTDEAGYDDFPVWVKHYDGGVRASGHGVSGWAWYGDEEGQGSFFAGIGYEITAQPRTSGRPLAIIRFPVITGDITTDAGNSPEVTVTYHGKSAYEAGTQTANNVGWNFIGNPYLTEYKAVTDTDMIVQSSFVEQMENDQWTGSYEWKVTTARFITVPYDTYNDYHHELVKNYTIPAFSTFFFQFADDATGTFRMGGTRPQAALAPARFGATPKATPEISLDIMLSGTGEAEEGKAGLIIHETYDGGLKDFEDVEQWFVGNNVQKTYTFASGTALAYNLLNEEAINELIPMGYIATVGGEHVYALNEENDVSALEHLWLIDYTTGVTTDLLVRNYSFVTAAGRFDSRFAINAVLKQEEVPTDISNTPGGDWATTIGVYSDENMLTLRGLPDNSAVYIYDMNGRLLQSSENLSNIASFSIATQGVYNIRVIAEGKAITLRTVLR